MIHASYASRNFPMAGILIEKATQPICSPSRKSASVKRAHPRAGVMDMRNTLGRLVIGTYESIGSYQVLNVGIPVLNQRVASCLSIAPAGPHSCSIRKIYFPALRFLRASFAFSMASWSIFAAIHGAMRAISSSVTNLFLLRFVIGWSFWPVPESS